MAATGVEEVRVAVAGQAVVAPAAHDVLDPEEPIALAALAAVGPGSARSTNTDALLLR